MWRKSDNIVHRLFDRQTCAAAPNTHMHRVRALYENIIPNETIYDVDCPDYYLCKFSNDGQYLICFTRNNQDLVVYRYVGMNYCLKGQNSDVEEEVPAKAKKFDSYFSQLYSLNLASGSEVICKDSFLVTDCNCYGIFVTATSPDPDAPLLHGAVSGVPSIEKITLYLVRLADGNVMDERKFYDDFIHLGHNTGIFMYDDLLSILSIRHQTIHILQVRNTGMFVDVQMIGSFCREDDELVLRSHLQVLRENPFSQRDIHEENSTLAQAYQSSLNARRGFDHAHIGDGEIPLDINAAVARTSLPAFRDSWAGGSVVSEVSVEYILSRRERDEGESSRQSQDSLLRTRDAEYFHGAGLDNYYPTTSFGDHDRSRFNESASNVDGRAVTPSGLLPFSSGAFNGGSSTTGQAYPGLREGSFSSARLCPEATSMNVNIQNEMGTGNLQTDHMLGGMKQRLMSFIFRSIDMQEMDDAKAKLLRKFYYYFQHYADLVMWKVQFLDRCHLLIKFGSVEGVLSHSSDVSQQTTFFVIYNIQSTQIIGFYQNSSEEFFHLFEQYYDHFRVVAQYPVYMRFISTYANNKSARDQLRKQKLACNSSKSSSYSQVIKRALAFLPCNSQSISPSAYFDQSLFHYDEKLISAADQYKPCTEHPIKFISRRKPNMPRFKINPGSESGTSDGRSKKVVSFIFHPIFPFAISVQQALMQPPVVNFHVRR